jgi:hypothetical protein
MPGLSIPTVSLETLAPMTNSSLETMERMGTGATGRPIWPSDLTGLQLWLQADQIQGIVSGASLSTWTDSSASNAHAAEITAAFTPIFLTNQRNGLSAVSFGGSTSQFMSSSISMGDGMTLAGAVAPSVGTPSQRLISASGGQVKLNVSASVGSIQYIRSAGIFQNALAPGTWISLFGFGDTATSNATLSVNGVITTGSAATSGTTGNSCQIGASGSSSLTWAGLAGELLIYNRNITESERSSLDSYLRTKWAI